MARSVAASIVINLVRHSITPYSTTVTVSV